MFALLNILALITLVHAAALDGDGPDYVHEGQTCSRIDLRPALERAGFASIRNQGGRLDGLSFAFSEMIGLAVHAPVSARWLEHRGDYRKVTRAILNGRLSPCLEDAVPSEDIESTRLARLRLLAEAPPVQPSVDEVIRLVSTFASISLTRATCTAPARLKPIASRLTEKQSIDAALEHGSLAITFADSASRAVAGRRLSPESGVCEYLVRAYQGPTCEPGQMCEDGSYWIERAKFRALDVWSLE